MALEKIKLIHGSPEWLAFRRTGIGGSDAAAILGIFTVLNLRFI